MRNWVCESRRNGFKSWLCTESRGRVAAYQDGSIWRMVVVVFALDFPEEPALRISAESRELRFFTPEELKDIDIVITHSDIVEDWFLKNIQNLN